jgi:D-tyrosyl-tRNA(Tyr) deacylase
MRAVLQRVNDASVSVEGRTVGAIEKGLFVLLGVMQGDCAEDARVLAEKICKLRIVSDENGKMNRSVKDVGGGILVVSNFTLGANYKHGNRPDYFASAAPELANSLYEQFLALCRERVEPVASGEFGEDMQIRMTADGPVTIVMDSDQLRGGKTG